MSAYKEDYQDKMQSSYDTDGITIRYENGDEEPGICLSSALCIAEEADDEIKQLRAHIERLRESAQQSLNAIRREAEEEMVEIMRDLLRDQTNVAVAREVIRFMTLPTAKEPTDA